MSKPINKSQVVAGLDIGTTKVAFVIGVVGPDENIDIIGVGNAPNFGMRQGVVVNIESTVDSILKAKEEAELMAGLKVNEVWLGVGGSHIESFDSDGMIAIRNKEVTYEDIERVNDTAKAVAIPTDRKVLHVIPQEYKVDGQSGISDPIGMSGVRLESSVHIITGNASAIHNSIKCTEKAGFLVKGIVLQQLAASLSTLTQDEKNLGVCLVDIGGGTCEIICYLQDSVVHTSLIPVGGNNFTHDVAMGLRTTQFSAENIKVKYGCALPDLVNEDETVEVETVGGRKTRTLSRLELCKVIEARAEETLQLVKQGLEEAGVLHQLGSGVVFAGGASQLPGLTELGDFIFEVPVRKGLPDRIGGLTDVVRSPSFASAVGLLHYAKKVEKYVGKERDADPITGWVSQISKKLKDYFVGAY